MSNRCRLFLREGGKPPPFDRRRCRLDSTAAGETIPAGGTFPIFSYNSSISLFWAACRVWTSVRCLYAESINGGMKRFQTQCFYGLVSDRNPASMSADFVCVLEFPAPDLLLSELLKLLQYFLVITVGFIAAQVRSAATVGHHP